MTMKVSSVQTTLTFLKSHFPVILEIADQLIYCLIANTAVERCSVDRVGTSDQFDFALGFARIIDAEDHVDLFSDECLA
jgi:hypothetical protein